MAHAVIDMVITVDNLEEVLGRIPDGVNRELTLHNVLDKSRFICQREIMDLEPVKTGYSRRNTTTELDALSARVTVQGGAAFADQGTQPHEILPTNVTYLKFVPQGGANPLARLSGRARSGEESIYVFALAVNHPGQAAENFMQQGLDNSLPDMRAAMIDELARMIGE